MKRSDLLHGYIIGAATYTGISADEARRLIENLQNPEFKRGYLMSLEADIDLTIPEIVGFVDGQSLITGTSPRQDRAQIQHSIETSEEYQRGFLVGVWLGNS
jgi:hypothetical protein